MCGENVKTNRRLGYRKSVQADSRPDRNSERQNVTNSVQVNARVLKITRFKIDIAHLPISIFEVNVCWRRCKFPQTYWNRKHWNLLSKRYYLLLRTPLIVSLHHSYALPFLWQKLNAIYLPLSRLLSRTWKQNEFIFYFRYINII